jgi:hypothetical protein
MTDTSLTVNIHIGDDTDIKCGSGESAAWVTFRLKGNHEVVIYTDHIEEAQALAVALRNCRREK